MRRRDFITLVGGAAAMPFAARAQQSERKRLVGMLTSFTESEMRPIAAGFRDRMRELGWIDGRNVTINLRASSGNEQQMDSDARMLVDAGADVIVAMGTPSLTAVNRVSRALPVVFTMVADPVSQGLIANLSRPGGNATGLTNFEFGIGGKWLELLPTARYPDVARHIDHQSGKSGQRSIRATCHRSRKDHWPGRELKLRCEAPTNTST